MKSFLKIVSCEIFQCRLADVDIINIWELLAALGWLSEVKQGEKSGHIRDPKIYGGLELSVRTSVNQDSDYQVWSGLGFGVMVRVRARIRGQGRGEG